MADPIVAAKSPAKAELVAGEEYLWCRCGRSQNQPFCDGSHRGTGITPLRFTAEEDGERWLCRCKQTGNAPFCDGTHKQLPDDVEAGQEYVHSDGTDGDDTGAPAARATAEEPTVEAIHDLARHGLEATGRHGELAAMGVPRQDLPAWSDLVLLPAQLAQRPLADDAPVDTRTIIGPRAAKPLELDTPLLVSDMSFGALSPEVKTALAKGAEAAGTGICSGEGGSLPAERAASSRYLFELGTACFGWSEELAGDIQAFHFKAGQAAKTGMGGHLPGAKVTEEIAATRGIPEGEDAISPAAFADLRSPADFSQFADHVRELSGGIPIGFKLSANRLEDDLSFALEAGADYVIVDGRGGGTGAAPRIIRDNISLPLLAAVPRARRFLDGQGAADVSLVVTGGIRLPADAAKALALGADAVALANAAIQAAGCVAARICDTNQCPSGVATQDPELRKRLNVDQSAERVARFLIAATDLMRVLARACGHDSLRGFCPADLSTWDAHIAELTGVGFAGVATTYSR